MSGIMMIQMLDAGRSLILAETDEGPYRWVFKLTPIAQLYYGIKGNGYAYAWLPKDSDDLNELRVRGISQQAAYNFATGALKPQMDGEGTNEENRQWGMTLRLQALGTDGIQEVLQVLDAAVDLKEAQKAAKIALDSELRVSEAR